MALGRQFSLIRHRRGGVAILLSLTLHLSAANVPAQESRPDLTGTWKLNRKLSKTAEYGTNATDVLVIKHSGSNLQMRHSNSPLGGETYSYVIDGKERLSNFSQRNGVFLAKAYWNGNTLVIEKHQQTKIGNFPSPEIFWTSRYSLSADGKTLAVIHQGTRAPTSSYHAELTYDKQ